jgi:transposase, IS30 family
MRFSYCMVPEVYQLFWAAMARGEFITDAAVEAGTYRKQGTRWLVAAGGVRPRRGRGLKGHCLTLAQREEIALGRARGQSVRSIAAAIRRSPSTVSRELRRNADRLGGYRATTAHALAYARASRGEDGEAGHQSGAAWQGGGRPGQEVLPGADRGPVEGWTFPISRRCR